MLRRFEAYSFPPTVGPPSTAPLRSAFLDCSRHIPEVLHSAVGQDVSGAAVDLVWEHAYLSPETYRRYMEHPFHASVLDRYLLPDSPERIVADNRLGIGLAGYACERPDYFLASGLRRLVFLDLRRATSAQLATLADTARHAPGPDVSIFAANTLASAWFDGETPLGTGQKWTHLWEQGFRDEAGLHRHLEGADDPGGRDGHGWERVPGVVASLTVSYRITPGWGYLAPV